MNFQQSTDREEPPLQTMSAPSSPPKRPRLSLQIKAPAVPQVLGKSVTALKADFSDPYSPTAFNTLSNAYAAAIESSSPRTARPDQVSKPTVNAERPRSLRLQTPSSDSSSGNVFSNPVQRLQTPGPFANITPDSPYTAHPSMSPSSKGSSTNTAFPFTFTPPQSAHPQESTDPKVFTFASTRLPNTTPISPNNALRRRNTIASLHSAPYTHPRSLRSILRNSPLPPRSSMTPASPSRLSLRYNPNKKVGYNTPLTQTITTNKYVRSHIDLLAEDASPFTPTDPDKESVLEAAFVYTGDETRDGGQTPGPYEEMRRRMASLGDDSTISSNNTKKDSLLRKRKRREKKRQWIWTIGDNEEEEGGQYQDQYQDQERFSEQDRIPRTVTVDREGEGGTCSVPPMPGSATGVMGEFSGRRESSSSSSGSGSDERDSDMGESFGSPHSV